MSDVKHRNDAGLAEFMAGWDKRLQENEQLPVHIAVLALTISTSGPSPAPTWPTSLPSTEVNRLVSFFNRQTTVGQSGSRYIDSTPYPGLPAPIVASSWGFQLRLSSPSDPRLQQFVNTFPT